MVWAVRNAATGGAGPLCDRVVLAAGADPVLVRLLGGLGGGHRPRGVGTGRCRRGCRGSRLLGGLLPGAGLAARRGTTKRQGERTSHPGGSHAPNLPSLGVRGQDRPDPACPARGTTSWNRR